MRMSEEQFKELQAKREKWPTRRERQLHEDAQQALTRLSGSRKAAVRPKQVPGQMNKTEARYLHQVLEPGIAAGRYRAARFEAIRFKLADRTHYTPDFQVINNETGEIEFHEVKGGRIEDDAMVKFKTAAAMFPEYRWKLVQQKKVSGPWATLLEV